MIDAASISAASRLPGTMSLCSLASGTRSLLLRRFDEPLEAEFETLPTSDQLIVLVRRGACSIECKGPVGWRGAQYREGDLGMISPGEASRLRFRGAVAHQTLHLHIPGVLLTHARAVAERRLPALHDLQVRHDLVAAVIVAAERGVEAGAPAIVAESAIHYLLLQLMLDAGAFDGRRDVDRKTRLVGRIDAFMRSNLAAPITLADIAGDAGIDVFHLIRLCRATWGATPAARLTMLRLEHGCHLLTTTDHQVTELALECGYSNPSHFATAFRRRYGMAPTALRRAMRT